MTRERLQKLLARAGLGSRRSCEEMVASGRVTVDGRMATLGDQADPATADIRVDGARVDVDPDRVYLMLNKPRDVVTTLDDPHGRTTVADLVDVDERVFPVGRLDRDTEGLVLLTNDGDLAHELMHPSYEVPRTYVALVPGAVSDGTVARLREGVQLEDGLARPRSARVLRDDRQRALLEVVMTEGRKHEVRRLADAVGLPVERLARVAYDGVELGELGQGSWRPLTQREIGNLFAAVGRGEPSQVERSSLSDRRARGQPGGDRP